VLSGHELAFPPAFDLLDAVQFWPPDTAQAATVLSRG
jgi:hypothetical protein